MPLLCPDVIASFGDVLEDHGPLQPRQVEVHQPPGCARLAHVLSVAGGALAPRDQRGGRRRR
eukprot:5933626-Alexandrium_andersonii.AAC.1